MAQSTFQSALDREDFAHPENIYKDLFLLREDEPLSTDAREKLAKLKPRGTTYHGDMNEEKLCWSCGWSVYNELLSSYGSRIRIIYTKGNVGIWEVGSRWLIRDRPNDASLGSDYITQEFLRNHHSNLKIPLVKEMRKLSAPTDKVDLTLMSRAEGVGLDTIWGTLSPEEKANYRYQLGDAIRSWRQLTSPVAKNVDGSIPEDGLIGNCRRRFAPTCKKMGRTTEEWFGNLEKELKVGIAHNYDTKDPVVIERVYQKLKNEFPKSEPYVLTHGDLNLSNIMVKEGKIEAIIDWEGAAFLPWWAERWLSLRWGNDDSDELFYPLWEDIGSEMDRDTFQTEVMSKVARVTRAWGRSYFHTEHPDSQTMWQRPGFCECKPYAGAFNWDQLGNQIEHKLHAD